MVYRYNGISVNIKAPLYSNVYRITVLNGENLININKTTYRAKYFFFLHLKSLTTIEKQYDEY